ncbi:hypothetical protein ACVWZM_009061 [Bradyrhizobium sp. USDA 4501]
MTQQTELEARLAIRQHGRDRAVEVMNEEKVHSPFRPFRAEALAHPLFDGMRFSFKPMNCIPRIRSPKT